ncbi:putative ATP-dependent RNA helicase DDX60 isoform X1 [Camelus bactrianus]|uniref:ATP-dependent RNA helicase DDX60 isoform X1 n=2 Tax=Camelus bactrianus TaxID=9837 RepID=A0AC58P545_CAMBA
MLKLYFLFSLQFLVKEGYVDREGNPMGFAGLVSHLHYHEPSNLVFVSFLVKGLFHNLCQPTRRGSKCFSQDVMERLVLVLAHLFGRRYIPAKFQDANLKFYQSKVFLEDLPEDFKAALDEYNMNVTKGFASFLLVVSKLADMKQEHQLPLSKIDFTGKECEDSQLVSHLLSCKEGRRAVSPFACLSGNSDADLLHPETPDHVTRCTIGISNISAPVLWPQRLDNQGRRMPLNAYALDFYKHGSLLGLVQDNRCVSPLCPSVSVPVSTSTICSLSLPPPYVCLCPCLHLHCCPCFSHCHLSLCLHVFPHSCPHLHLFLSSPSPPPLPPPVIPTSASVSVYISLSISMSSYIS